ncbi:MAG: FAD-dependent oxidoreductase [Syntrophales bacterium]
MDANMKIWQSRELAKILDQCLGEEMPPCKAACPLHVDAKRYVDSIAQGKCDESLSVVCERLPFPGILGRICMHPCESKCRRGDKDEPIAIAALKRFATDHGTALDTGATPEETRKERVAVIGAGPAGLMAAYELRKIGYQVTILEALPFAGGMMRAGIPEWRLPRAVLEGEIGIVERMGAEIRFNTVVGKNIALDDLRRDFDAVFVAVGAHAGSKLGIPGEGLAGVYQGVAFLRAVNMGEKVAVGKVVVVVGGGNVALDAARAALRLGASSVSVVYRRSRTEMPVVKSEVDEAEQEGVKIRFLATPIKIVEEGGHVSGLRCIEMELRELDKGGRRKPVPVTGSEFMMKADMVIVAIGQSPDLSFIGQEESLLMTTGGLLSADALTLQTGLRGVFAGGDTVTGPAAVVDALAAGRKAAFSIDRYLRGEDMSVNRERECSQNSRLTVELEGVELAQRVAMPTLPVDERTGFDEVELGYSEEEAKQEADRCLRCECKTCVKECEFLAAYCEAPKELAERIAGGACIETPETVFACNLCSLCEMVCPNDLNVGRMCLDMRRQMVERGLAPLPKHQPVISTYEFVKSDAFALTLSDSATQETKRFFFPGCNLSAYSPDLVQKTYEYLCNKLPGTGIILGCCGGPVYGIGDQARFLEVNSKVVSEMKGRGALEMIAACPHCYHIFHEHATDIKLISLYEVIAEQGLPEGARLSANNVFSLHDSCNTRHEVQVQEAVRQLLKDLGCTIHEPKFSREMTRCCGMGGMAAFADFKLANKIITRRTREMPHDVVSYCASCRDAFAMVGKSSLHLLDLIFNSEWEQAKKNRPKQGPAKQKTQSELRERLLKGAKMA